MIGLTKQLKKKDLKGLSRLDITAYIKTIESKLHFFMYTVLMYHIIIHRQPPTTSSSFGPTGSAKN